MLSASTTASTTEALLLDAEASQEQLAAGLRLIVFGALLATALSLTREGEHHLSLLATTLAYGGLTIAGLVIAWRRLFHPFLPYVFVTLEIGLVAAQAVLYAATNSMPIEMVMVMPVTGVVFIVLAHASMRYRPWLVMYAAGLFLGAIAVGWATFGAVGGGPHQGHPGGAHDFVIYQLLPLVTLLVTSAVLFFSNVRTRRLLQDSVQGRVSTARLSRFFAPAIADRLASAPDDPLMEGQRMLVAVLFADIRNFSALVEAMEPEEVGKLLADYREVVATEVRDHGGVVDKFIGDAVMAVFGITEAPEKAAKRALDCAVRMLRRVEEWSRSRELSGQRKVQVGIGAHFGHAFVGVIGKESLLEFTVIGDTVNVAERLERLTRDQRASIAVSRRLYEMSGELPVQEHPWTLVEGCSIPGRVRTLDVFLYGNSTL